jgi:hypothetical protein
LRRRDRVQIARVHGECSRRSKAGSIAAPAAEGRCRWLTPRVFPPFQGGLHCGPWLRLMGQHWPVVFPQFQGGLHCGDLGVGVRHQHRPGVPAIPRRAPLRRGGLAGVGGGLGGVPAIPRRAPLRRRHRPHEPKGLALSDHVRAEQVKLDSSGDVGDAGLAGLAGREVAGFLGLAGADPVRAVPDEGGGGEDLQQECGEREIGLLRGKKPRRCPTRRPGRAGS